MCCVLPQLSLPQLGFCLARGKNNYANSAMVILQCIKKQPVGLTGLCSEMCNVFLLQTYTNNIKT